MKILEQLVMLALAAYVAGCVVSHVLAFCLSLLFREKSDNRIHARDLL